MGITPAVWGPQSGKKSHGSITSAHWGHQGGEVLDSASLRHLDIEREQPHGACMVRSVRGQPRRLGTIAKRLCGTQSPQSLSLDIVKQQHQGAHAASCCRQPKRGEYSVSVRTLRALCSPPLRCSPPHSADSPFRHLQCKPAASGSATCVAVSACPRGPSWARWGSRATGASLRATLVVTLAAHQSASRVGLGSLRRPMHRTRRMPADPRAGHSQTGNWQKSAAGPQFHGLGIGNWPVAGNWPVPRLEPRGNSSPGHQTPHGNWKTVDPQCLL